MRLYAPIFDVIENLQFKMKKWVNCFCFILALLFAMPSYAFARGEGELIGMALIYFLIVVVVFLIFREVICWYWKINTRIELLANTMNLLTNQTNKRRSRILHIVQNISLKRLGLCIVSLSRK